jgi:hypothetical protein
VEQFTPYHIPYMGTIMILNIEPELYVELLHEAINTSHSPVHFSKYLKRINLLDQYCGLDDSSITNYSVQLATYGPLGGYVLPEKVRIMRLLSEHILIPNSYPLFNHILTKSLLQSFLVH